MQPKLLFKTAIAEYRQAEWTGKNQSGVQPVGDRVLVKPDQAAGESSGGIMLPDDLKERHTLAAEAGIVIALGDGAFKWNSDRQTPFYGRVPKPGNRVCLERYSGQLIRGDDGETYRLMESACIAAIITPEVKAKKLEAVKETA